MSQVRKDRDAGQRQSPRLGAASWVKWFAGFVLATLGFLQGPAVVEDVHRRMCGWPRTQAVASWFGDCASYAQKSSSTVVINGPVVPQGPVANKVIYDQTYPVFVAALGEADEHTLKQLLQSDFRVKNSHLCAALEHYMPDTTKDLHTLAGLLSQFASDGVKCKGSGFGMDRELAPDAFLLTLGFDAATGTCNSKYSSEHWAKTVALIDGWIAKKSQSKEFSTEARSILDLVRHAASLSYETAMQKCVEMLRNDESGEARVSSARRLLKAVHGCVFRNRDVDLFTGDRVAMNVGLSMSGLPTHGPEYHKTLCKRGLDEKLRSGAAIDARIFEAALIRWAQ